MPATKFLRDDQVADLSFMMREKRCALLHDPGAGKTPPVCVLAYWLWTHRQERCAWAMPKSLLKKNYDELLTFTDFTPDDIIIVDGPPMKRLAQMQSNAKVFLMGFDRWSAEWRTLCRYHPDLKALLVDEIHLGYSTMSAKRTQQMIASMHHLDRFVAMTGTLIAGRLDSAYPTIHVIEPRYYGSINAFMAYHAVKDDFGRVIYWKNHEKISAIMGRHAIKRTFESIYGSQEVHVIPEVVPMAPDQRAKYDEFEQKALLELEDEFLDGSIGGGVFTMRCRQIMQCPELFDLCKGEKTGKDERLEIHLADHKNTGRPLTIFSPLIAEHERLNRLIHDAGFRVDCINGDVPATKRAKIDQQYQNGELDVVIATAQTAGIGFNWGHVDHALFTGLDYRDDSFEQAVRRHIRGKRDRALRVSVLEYERSIDQQIMAKVERKSADAAKVDPTKTPIKFHK